MLTGHESLHRVIGKRRRFLPNRSSLLSIPVVQDVNNEMEDDKTQVEISTSDWVLCPVCCSKIRGEDSIINSHLDACLSSGRKRKLTQHTLLHFNFFSSQSQSNGVADNTTTFGSKESNHCELPLVVKPIAVETEVGSVIEKPNNGCLLSLKDKVPECYGFMTLDEVLGVTLETFIVGRRFSAEKELNIGETICFLREPDNVKDPNAIKVILADSTHNKALGFLPCKLAQYLSPLIEKYCLSFKGHVTFVPNSSHDVVPIRIMCCEVVSLGDRDHGEIEAITCLWKNALHAVESTKSYASSATKYQQNFCLLIKEVLRSNPHLFTNDEKIFMESFFSLPNGCQRLFIRLYTRKGPWFRTSNISYPEVSDSKQAIKELSGLLGCIVATGYMSTFEDPMELPNVHMEEILNLLTISELREITSMFKKNGTRYTRKQDLIATLLAAYENRTCLFLPTTIFHRTGMCTKISTKAESILWRVQRLFFLHGEQDLSAFLLVDLGIVKYPSYLCLVSEQIFSTRNNLLAYEEAIEVAQIMDECLEENNSELVLRYMKIADSRLSSSNTEGTQSMASNSATIFLSCFSASWVYSKVVFLGISFLEHKHRYKDAINLLKRLLACFPCDGRRGYWTLRLSIDLECIGCTNESLSVAEDGLLDPWVRAGSRIGLQRRVLRLGKPPRRWKTPSFSHSIKRKIKEVHIQGRPLNCEIGKKSRFYGEDGEQCGVEQIALQYYAGDGGGWNGVHSESGIWLTIFGLLMWDIIFSDVPNVFHNRFQTAPLDLETDGFYIARKSLIESHLQKIHDGMAEEIVIKSWELHSGTSCRGVSWDRHSLSEIRAAVTCIGGPCLAALCRHLAQDYRSWSSGMPDLFLWRFNGEYRGEAKLVEVKGPKDRLSEQQHAWLLLLMDCGFNTEVCKVSPVFPHT